MFEPVETLSGTPNTVQRLEISLNMISEEKSSRIKPGLINLAQQLVDFRDAYFVVACSQDSIDCFE